MTNNNKEGAILEIGGMSNERPNLVKLTAWVTPEALGVLNLTPSNQADLLKQRLKLLALAALESPQAWDWK